MIAGSSTKKGRMKQQNAWKKDNSRRFQSRSRNSSTSGTTLNDAEEFPTLAAASATYSTRNNVWEQRMSKQEEIKSMLPQSQYDEELMLQQAIKLSMLEEERQRKEEERQQKLDEEYVRQLEALECSPEELEDAKDEFFVAKSDTDSDVQKKQPTSNYVPSNSESDGKFHEKTCNAGGARPKINKVIERFGGWGLKDEKKGNASQKLSEFVDDVVREKPVKKVNVHDGGARGSSVKNINKRDVRETPVKKFRDNSAKKLNYNEDVKGESLKKASKHKVSNCLNSYKSEETKEIVDLNCDDGWDFSATKDVLKSSHKGQSSAKDTFKWSVKEPTDNGEILYDEKGTFVEYEANWSSSCDIEKDSLKQPVVSPNKVLDTWLSSEDKENLHNDEILQKKEGSDISYPLNESSSQHVSSFSAKSHGNVIKNDTLESNTMEDSIDLLLNTCKTTNDTWSNATDNNALFDDIKSCQNRYDMSNQNNDFPSFHEPTEIPSLPSSDIWSDKSSNNSLYFSSFSDNEHLSRKSNLTSKTESKFDCDNILKSTTSNDNADLPPILPPQPPSSVSAVHRDETFAAAALETDFQEGPVPPPIAPPQPVPELPLPQFPILPNPLFNPMFPGFNPMLGFGMDHLLMRQMFMLSNPFLASHMIALEQHYKSLGINIDLFSVPSPIPTMPVLGMMDPSLMQQLLSNNMNLSVPPDASQLQTDFNDRTSESERDVIIPDPKSFEKFNQASAVDAVSGHNKTLSPTENVNDNSWYNAFQSRDSMSVIPPPKPLANEVSCNDAMSVQKTLDSSQSASQLSNNKFINSYDPDKVASPVPLAKKESQIPGSATEAAAAKTESLGWGNLEDELGDEQNCNNWDDGWSHPVPPRPLKNSSICEDKKRPVFRQPAKQPQISRIQRNNRPYN